MLIDKHDQHVLLNHTTTPTQVSRGKIIQSPDGVFLAVTVNHSAIIL